MSEAVGAKRHRSALRSTHSLKTCDAGFRLTLVSTAPAKQLLQLRSTWIELVKCFSKLLNADLRVSCVCKCGISAVYKAGSGTETEKESVDALELNVVGEKAGVLTVLKDALLETAPNSETDKEPAAQVPRTPAESQPRATTHAEANYEALPSNVGPAQPSIAPATVPDSQDNRLSAASGGPSSTASPRHPHDSVHRSLHSHQTSLHAVEHLALATSEVLQEFFPTDDAAHAALDDSELLVPPAAAGKVPIKQEHPDPWDSHAMPLSNEDGDELLPPAGDHGTTASAKVSDEQHVPIAAPAPSKQKKRSKGKRSHVEMLDDAAAHALKDGQLPHPLQPGQVTEEQTLTPSDRKRSRITLSRKAALQIYATLPVRTSHLGETSVSLDGRLVDTLPSMSLKCSEVKDPQFAVGTERHRTAHATVETPGFKFRLKGIQPQLLANMLTVLIANEGDFKWALHCRSHLKPLPRLPRGLRSGTGTPEPRVHTPISPDAPVRDAHAQTSFGGTGAAVQSVKTEPQASRGFLGRAVVRRDVTAVAAGSWNPAYDDGTDAHHTQDTEGAASAHPDLAALQDIAAALEGGHVESDAERRPLVGTGSNEEAAGAATSTIQPPDQPPLPQRVLAALNDELHCKYVAILKQALAVEQARGVEHRRLEPGYVAFQKTLNRTESTAVSTSSLSIPAAAGLSIFVTLGCTAWLPNTKLFWDGKYIESSASVLLRCNTTSKTCWYKLARIGRNWSHGFESVELVFEGGENWALRYTSASELGADSDSHSKGISSEEHTSEEDRNVHGTNSGELNQEGVAPAEVHGACVRVSKAELGAWRDAVHEAVACEALHGRQIVAPGCGEVVSSRHIVPSDLSERPLRLSQQGGLMIAAYIINTQACPMLQQVDVFQDKRHAASLTDVVLKCFSRSSSRHSHELNRYSRFKLSSSQAHFKTFAQGMHSFCIVIAGAQLFHLNFSSDLPAHIPTEDTDEAAPVDLGPVPSAPAAEPSPLQGEGHKTEVSAGHQREVQHERCPAADGSAAGGQGTSVGGGEIGRATRGLPEVHQQPKEAVTEAEVVPDVKLQVEESIGGPADESSSPRAAVAGQSVLQYGSRTIHEAHDANIEAADLTGQPEAPMQRRAVPDPVANLYGPNMRAAGNAAAHAGSPSGIAGPLQAPQRYADAPPQALRPGRQQQAHYRSGTAGFTVTTGSCATPINQMSRVRLPDQSASGPVPAPNQVPGAGDRTAWNGSHSSAQLAGGSVREFPLAEDINRRSDVVLPYMSALHRPVSSRAHLQFLQHSKFHEGRGVASETGPHGPQFRHLPVGNPLGQPPSHRSPHVYTSPHASVGDGTKLQAAHIQASAAALQAYRADGVHNRLSAGQARENAQPTDAGVLLQKQLQAIAAIRAAARHGPPQEAAFVATADIPLLPSDPPDTPNGQQGDHYVTPAPQSSPQKAQVKRMPLQGDIGSRVQPGEVVRTAAQHPRVQQSQPSMRIPSAAAVLSSAQCGPRMPATQLHTPAEASIVQRLRESEGQGNRAEGGSKQVRPEGKALHEQYPGVLEAEVIHDTWRQLSNHTRQQNDVAGVLRARIDNQQQHQQHDASGLSTSKGAIQWLTQSLTGTGAKPTADTMHQPALATSIAVALQQLAQRVELQQGSQAQRSNTDARPACPEQTLQQRLFDGVAMDVEKEVSGSEVRVKSEMEAEDGQKAGDAACHTEARIGDKGAAECANQQQQTDVHLVDAAGRAQEPRHDVAGADAACDGQNAATGAAVVGLCTKQRLQQHPPSVPDHGAIREAQGKMQQSSQLQKAGIAADDTGFQLEQAQGRRPPEAACANTGSLLGCQGSEATEAKLADARSSEACAAASASQQGQGNVDQACKVSQQPLGLADRDNDKQPDCSLAKLREDSALQQEGREECRAGLAADDAGQAHDRTAAAARERVGGDQRGDKHEQLEEEEVEDEGNGEEEDEEEPDELEEYLEALKRTMRASRKRGHNHPPLKSSEVLRVNVAAEELGGKCLPLERYTALRIFAMLRNTPELDTVSVYQDSEWIDTVQNWVHLQCWQEEEASGREVQHRFALGGLQPNWAHKMGRLVIAFEGGCWALRFFTR